MDHHSFRLVDEDKVLVLIENIQVHGLCVDFRLHGLRHRHDDPRRAGRVQPLEVIAKAVAVTLAYLLGFAITSHFHEASSLTGAMLACVSAIVVQQQPDIRHAVQQGWLRVLGTFIGAVVAYVYLVNFRFSPAGMVVAVVLEEVICMMFKVPDNGKMATITLIIVLIVSERSPDLSPLANGLLRFSEATVGAVVGIAAVWPVDRYRRWRQASAASSPKE